MDSFQKGVLISASIILIAALVFIGIMLKYAKDENWPPIVGACPDYWTMNKEGKCVNVKGLGTCTDAMDFKDYDMCKKYNWANSCKVAWDGISYGYGATKPCA